MSEIELQLGPGLCGFTVSLIDWVVDDVRLSGCTVGQSMFYFSSFPQDLRSLKTLVSFLLVMDALHGIFNVRIHWKFLVLCHCTNTLSCPPDIPWEMMAAMFVHYIVASVVQCFFAHRIWIISGRNVLLTFLTIATSLTQFAFGLTWIYRVLVTGNKIVLYSTPWSPRSALLGAICDVLITGSVFFYLREGRRKVRRSQNYLRHLTIVFINMGLFTCLLSIGWCLMYIIPGGQYFISMPTTFVCGAYANSMMAVVNARKSVREREQDLIANGHNLATLDIN